MKTKLLFWSILITIFSCTPYPPDEELTMQRAAFLGSEIKIDGYYTGFKPNSNILCDYIFFYSNGIIYSFGYKYNINNESNISAIITNSKKESYKQDWAVFKVVIDTVIIQGWVWNDESFNYKINNYKYRIINDSTLLYRNSNNETTMYHFKKFAPKPDSTNIFIK